MKAFFSISSYLTKVFILLETLTYINVTKIHRFFPYFLSPFIVLHLLHSLLHLPFNPKNSRKKKERRRKSSSKIEAVRWPTRKREMGFGHLAIAPTSPPPSNQAPGRENINILNKIALIILYD